MTTIGKLNVDVNVDTAELTAAIHDIQDAIQNLNAKLKALNEVDVPVEIGGIKRDSTKRIRNATLKMANKPSPSYRAADPQASEF